MHIFWYLHVYNKLQVKFIRVIIPNQNIIWKKKNWLGIIGHVHVFIIDQNCMIECVYYNFFDVN
jgi:hypothetical protein